MAQEEMRQRLEWSMFSEPGYMSVGDEYSDHKEKRIHEIKGVRNFQTAPLHKGQTGSNWGKKTREYVPAWTGEPYVDPLLARRRAKKLAAGGKPPLTQEGFRYTGPSKKPTGPGDLHGSFTKRHLGLQPARARAASSGPKGRKQHDAKGGAENEDENHHRNVVVSNPARQGTGPNCRPLSGGNFPALRGRYRNKGFSFRDEDAEHRRKMADKRPFSSGVAPRYTFDVREHAPTPGGVIYRRDERCLPPRADGSERLTRKQRTERRLAGLPEKPFRPTHPTKSGSQGTLSKYPEYVPDKYDTWKIEQAMKSQRLLPDHRRKQGLSEAMASRPSWRYNPGRKTKVTRSVAVGNLSVANVMRARR